MEVLHFGCSGGALPLLTPFAGGEKQLVGVQNFGGWLGRSRLQGECGRKAEY